MLEVKIAEVSKTLLDRFGLDFSRLVTSADGLTSSIIVGGSSAGAPQLPGRFHPNVSGGHHRGFGRLHGDRRRPRGSASMSTTGA